MIQVYKHSNGHLEDNISLASAEKGSWIHVVNPDSEDLQLVSMVTEIPTDVLKTALDTEERSHVEIEDNYIFVVINIVEEIAKPITLACRLFGNIMAGEILIVVLLMLMPIWMPIPAVCWLAFSIFIGGVQAVIFTMLSMAYLANAVKEGTGE